MSNNERDHLESILGLPFTPTWGLLRLSQLAEDGWKEINALDEICKRAQSATQFRTTYRQARRHRVRVGMSQKFFVSGLRFHQWSIFKIGLANPRLWQQSIADKRIEIIDGRLILAVLNQNANDTQVLLAEQGQGMSLKPAIANITKSPSHGWTIKGKTDKKHPALELLCHSIHKAKDPDDVIWSATVATRIALDSRT